MKSLTDHNERQMELHRQAPDPKLDISCDKCGGELYNPHPNTSLTVDPPMIHVACTRCDFTGYALA